MVLENKIAGTSFYCLLTTFLLVLLLLFNNNVVRTKDRLAAADRCAGKRIRVYDLPPQFNEELLKKCDSDLVTWLNFCKHISNDGFGQPIIDADLLGKGWYRTDSYMLEVIFHSRIRSYSCLTNISSQADAFFLPYYAGLDALHFLYNDNVDKSSHGAELLSWIRRNAAEEWNRKGGRDHFLVMGRTSWDFQSVNAESSSSRSQWGTGILNSPEFANMTILFLEKNPWMINQRAVPYPTSFHPDSGKQIHDWLSKVRSSQRRYLFTFAGAPRPSQKQSIRELVLYQCVKSESCRFVDCDQLSCGHNPAPIVSSFLESDFCLQPRGDSSTRRSAFDAIISGCIPVFFHNDSAYSQYAWHLPADSSSFSVMIDEDVVRRGTVEVEEILRKFSREEVEAMRSVLLKMVPRVIYSRGEVLETDDAFDISIMKTLDEINQVL